MAALTDTLEMAAAMLDEEAEVLKACSTVNGRWTGADKARAAYDRYRLVAKRLRKGRAYLIGNPLGGPAKVFDAIADHIRAGDSVEQAMRVFGVKWADA